MSNPMKTLAVLLALCAGPVLGQSPEPPLAVAGPGIKAVTIVDKFPFTVSAPAGAAFYFWQAPAGVEFTDKGETIDVTAAPAGELKLACKYVTADWDAKKFVTNFRTVTVYVGGIGPPPDPGPDDAVPSAALKKAMQDAYAADTDPQKAAHTRQLADLLHGVVSACKDPGSGIQTNTQFQTAVHKATNLALKGPTDDGSGALPVVRPAVGAFIQTRLPRTPGVAVDAEFWRAASIAYSQVSQALKGAVR